MSLRWWYYSTIPYHTELSPLGDTDTNSRTPTREDIERMINSDIALPRWKRLYADVIQSMRDMGCRNMR